MPRVRPILLLLRRNSMIMRKVVLASGLLLSLQGFAQNTLEMNPVTVTANRTPQKVNETGRNITVIDGSLFKQLPVQSIDELLKYVPGVEVQARGPMGSQSDIVIRGGTFQQVLVLLDGIKLNDPITGHFSSYIPVTPNEIERIEVLRGPAAAVYGAEAVGGVINVITKTFAANHQKVSKNTTAGFAIGEYGFMQGNGGWNKTGKKLNIGLGAFSNNATGQLLRGKNRGYLHNHTFNASASLVLKNGWVLAARSSFDNRRFAAQNFYTTYKSDTATERVNTWWNQVQIRQQKNKRTQQVDVVYKHTNDHYLYNPVSIANDNKSNFILVQYINSHQLNRNYSLTLGTQLDRRAIVSNDRGNHATHHSALYASLLYAKKKWKIAPSLRGDWDENYGGALLPQINASYQLKDITFRANAGRAIRSADFTERFNNYNKPIVMSGSIGNPDLKTENSWSYEAGADAFVGNNFKVSLTGFYRDQDNVIDYVPTKYADMPRTINLVPNGSYSLTKNIKKVQTRGIELDLAWQKTFEHKHMLFVTAGITLLKSESSDSISSFYIVSHAKTLAQANIVYSFNRFRFSANLVFKQRDARAASSINAAVTKDYFLLNARIGFEFYKKAQCFISCNNVTDITYSDLLGSIMPRRWVTGGINVDL